MLGEMKLFTFRGSSMRGDQYGMIERNYEDFYHQMRDKNYVPVLGSEDINIYKEGEYSVEWLLKVLGRECDRPWEVRGVTQEGEIKWFTTPQDTSRTYSMA